MKKVTAEQLKVLKIVAGMQDFEKARELVKLAGIKPDTVFTTEEEKRIALNARAALYNPRDLGKFGKLNEIEKRVNASYAPMKWASFNARSANLADQTVKIDGVTYSIEHISGAGDWYKTHCETLEKAMQEYGKRKKLLVWDTDEFTLVIPFGCLVNALDGYVGRGTKGWKTFFKAELAENADCTAHIVQMQEWKTSTPKKAYLDGLSTEYREYYELVKDLLFR